MAHDAEDDADPSPRHATVQEELRAAIHEQVVAPVVMHAAATID